MKTPWINYRKMHEICSNQMIVFKSPPVQNISIALNFISINGVGTETDKNISELDTTPIFDNVNATNNPQEDIDVNNVPEQNENSHTDSIQDLFSSFDGIDTETDSGLNLSDSTDNKHNFKTISADETNNTAQKDFFGLHHPSESDFMRKGLHEKEEVDEPHPAEETKDTAQTDFAFDHQQPSESDFMHQMKDHHKKEKVDEPQPAEETKDTAQTDFAFDHHHPSESDFMGKELHEKEEVDEPHPAEETKDTARTDFAFDHQQPSESDFIRKELHEKEEVDEPHPAEETNDTLQIDSAVDHQQPYESDLMNEKKDHHDKEEVFEARPADETNDTAQIESAVDLHHPSESDFMNEKKGFHDKEEVFEPRPADETNDTAHIESAVDLHHPSKSDFMNEKKAFHEKEEVDETHPADKKNKTSQIDSAANLHHPSKSDFMNEKKDHHDKEEVVEPRPADETNDTPQTDSAVDHQQPSESDLMKEKKDCHDKEEVVEPRPADETNDTAQIESAVDHQRPSESDFMNEKKDLHEKEEVDEPQPAEETRDTAQTDFAFDYQQPSETDLLNEKKDLLDNEEMDETDPTVYTSGFKNGQGKVYFMTKKSPFSIHVEIDDFLHAPICGDIVQNKFEFLDLNNKHTPEFDTKLINTTAYYPEQPDCRLVCSKIHEFVFLTYDQNEGKSNKGNHYKSIAVPMHGSLFTEAEESNNNSYMHIRVPVVLGEYKIEICLEENVTFKEEVKGIKGVSKEVVISNFRLVPTVLSQSLNNGTRTILKGILFIEGYIDQKIEYTAFPNKITESLTPLNQLNQKMSVELMIHILQVQQVRVKR